MRLALLLALSMFLYSCEPVPMKAQLSTLASVFTIASATDSILGAHVQKSTGNAIKRAGKWITKPFHKRSPDCLDVTSGPCVVGEKKK